MSRRADLLRCLKNMNGPLMAIMAALLVIGVFFIYSACYISEDQPARTLYRLQMIWIAIGLVGFFGLSLLDYRLLSKVMWWAYGFSLALLVLVLVAGELVYGARRRLEILGISVQPSEVAKLTTMVTLAVELSRPGVDVKSVKTLAVAVMITLVPFLLIFKQPDLGTAMVFIPLTLALLFAAGVPLRYLAVPIVAGLVAVGLLLALLLLPEKLHLSHEMQQQIWEWTHLSEYQKDRILVYLGLVDDPLGVGWNKIQAQIAVGSGGPWGKGFLNGTQNILGFLPRSVAPTDFIYSVIAEEAGFLGSVTVLTLFGLLMVISGRIALRQQNHLGRLLSVGVLVLFFTHVFINIAMTVGLMPITGIPLPLLSYGGSFMVVMLSALGILQSVHIRTRKPVIFE